MMRKFVELSLKAGLTVVKSAFLCSNIPHTYNYAVKRMTNGVVANAVVVFIHFQNIQV